MRMSRFAVTVGFLVCFLILGSVAAPGQAAQSQYPMLDKLADKVIAKYKATNCAELKAQKAEKKAPTPQEEKAIEFLKSDPKMRTYFLNRVAAPIANKMFDCGMIP